MSFGPAVRNGLGIGLGPTATLATAFSQATLDFDFIDNLVFPTDITFTRASSATYFNSAGVLTTAANNVPRLDYNPATLAPRGLLIEEQRVNSIRNNTMVGGGAGVAPTNWTASGSTANGITVTVIGVGTENGINYVDYEINGTATLTGTALSIGFDTSTGIVASVGQVWTWAAYLRLVAGALTGLTITPRIAWRDSGGAALSSNDGTSVPTSAGLATQRFLFSATAPASTGYVAPQLRIGVVNGTTYTGVQIRIGLPQLEQGAFATSVIPTTTAAATRSADVASVNTLSPWFNATAGTLYTETLATRQIATAGTGLASFDDGTTSNMIRNFVSASAFGRFGVFVSGVLQADLTPGIAITANTVLKLANAYAVNDFASVSNASAAATDTSGTLPTVSLLRLGSDLNGVPLNGYLRRITYYPSRLSNAQLQALTA